ncbi:hypothetical protein M885DRAFT_505897 [Pelagophyceae sp. CCMP2097]|nr:hypothetical protein M885DRAFT_505897 [Pelagophyceae sp. CCMP2097]
MLWRPVVRSAFALQRGPLVRMSAWAAPADAAEADMCTEVVSNLKWVKGRVDAASNGRARNPNPTLIAVSKTKPLSYIAAAAAAGQVDFGENYVQELVEKADLVKAAVGAPTIRWHFIGKLQSNKVKSIVQVPSLYAIHTVDKEKLATMIDKNWAEFRPHDEPVRVFIQVNTSGEEQKGGCQPSDAPALAKIITALPRLELIGVMCIGKYSGAEGDASPDFVVLNETRDAVASALGVAQDAVALSMGMSHDFETAIEHDATHVRVGSTIFGKRDYAKA